jgi:hypothetical protein
MTEREDELRDNLCDAKMTGLTKLITEQFSNVNKQISSLSNHIATQNGTVKDLVNESIKRQQAVSDFRHLEEEFKGVKDKVEQIDKDLLEVWFFKKYPKVFLGIITAAVLATLGFSTINNWKVRNISKKVNYIEAYEKIPYAPTRGAVMDTLKF